MPTVEEIRASRPREPGHARIALVVAAVLWLPAAGDYSYYHHSGPLGLALLLMVFGSFGAVKGRQAGRILATVAIGATYLYLLPYVWWGFPELAVVAVLDIVAVVLSVFALTRLYHPNTSRYIHLVTVARQAART